MPRYQAQWKYRSNGFGPWDKGDEVELQVEEAAYVNRDSPGVLKEVDPHAAAARKRAERERVEYETAVAASVPDGPISAVLEWVDKVPAARAARIDKALQFERDKGSKARTTLVETLQQLAAEA